MNLTPLTQERLEQVSRKSSVCDLAVIAEHGGAIWLLHSYHKSTDIAEGMLCIDPALGDSEHGSIYGQQLLTANVEEVIGVPEVTFKECINWDFEAALQHVNRED